MVVRSVVRPLDDDGAGLAVNVAPRVVGSAWLHAYSLALLPAAAGLAVNIAPRVVGPITAK